MPPFGFGGPLTRLRAYGSTVEQASDDVNDALYAWYSDGWLELI